MFNDWAGATVLLVVGGSLMTLMILAMLLPTGPTTEATGRLERVALTSSKLSSPYRGIVRLRSGFTVDIPLPRRHECKTGDPVVVLYSPRIWGVDMAVKSVGCAASTR